MALVFASDARHPEALLINAPAVRDACLPACARALAGARAPGRSRRGRHGHRRLALAAVIVLAAVLGTLSPALAAEPAVKLSLRPIDAGGQYFDLTLSPGTSRSLTVELGNQGAAAIAVRTYAADVYTIINGGFGARLRDEPASVTTTWLDYAAEVLTLSPGQGVRRSFTLTVPPDAGAGEYITSLILENDEPIAGSGGIALNQIVRQALAVAITVPGPRAPGLAIGGASHKVVVDRSTVAVAVENTGNVRLKPVADLVIRDAAGVEVWRAAVPMDSFYAHTASLVEVPLASLLEPGQYTADLVLDEAANGVRVEREGIPFEVLAPPPPPTQKPILIEIGDAIEQTTQLPVGVIVGLVALVVVLGLLALGLVRRRSTR